MFKVQVFSLILLWLCLTLAMFSTITCATMNPIAKPGCATRCGNVTIPYPFGFGLDEECSMGYWYNIRCNTTFNPPKPFLSESRNLEILEISETHIRTNNFIAKRCYGSEEAVKSNKLINTVMMYLTTSPFMFSSTANKLTVIGCDDVAFFNSTLGQDFSTTGCLATCSTIDDVLKHNGSCSGLGCCQTPIPNGLKTFTLGLESPFKHRSVMKFNPCGYAFLADKDKYTFNVADLSDPTFLSRINNNLPVVLDWVVGANETCRSAQKNSTSYACQNNTNCTDFDIGSGGYRCSCLRGYEGNPYLPPGCTDIDECADPSHLCSNLCANTRGSYICSCPKGYNGDGLKNGTGCTINSQFVTGLSLGLSFVFLFVLMLLSWIYLTIRRKKLKEKREKFFGQNGGLLLKELLPQNGGTIESSKIFSAKELRIATKNYSDDFILGRGGFGMVYKGILKDGSEVAIKKSKVDDQDENQIKQFINEVVILTQIKHRNVVKLIGCCLETEIPLLVYEFISNGTLSEHIHKGSASWLTWENCVRVAAEAADALAYLHSAVSTPILHRDVKTANILIDESYTVKIADFGASRPAPVAKIQAATKLLGTRGYIDPECYQIGQLTDKSDVYSFGVVLAEILTKEKAVISERKMGEDYFNFLGGYFVKSIKKGCLMEILDPQLVKEASEEKLVSVANLVKRCLNLKGESRPTMREVALELESLKNHNKHPWANCENNEETSDLVVQQDDLYSVPSDNSYTNSYASNTGLSSRYSGQNESSSTMIDPR